jgi:quercetin dioxygenase-like cupin family protein
MDRRDVLQAGLEPAVELGPGQSFFEPMGSVRSTSANASATEPATIAVVILGRAGEPLSRPAPKPGA